MRSLWCLVSVAALSAASPCVAQEKSIIVLDGSGSMWGQIDGRPKLEIAREALASVVAGVPAENVLGLMAYGHREKGNCGDIELMVAPAAGSGAAITAAANGMKFLGKTPLTEAVRRAAAELRSTEEKATVILITDGIETCDADPCALGNELEASGVDFTAHVVGFGLTAEEGKTVACLAENTGGSYIEAKDASSLTQALQTAVATPPPAPPEPPQPAVLAHNFAPVVRLVAGGPLLDPALRPSVEVFPLENGIRAERVLAKYDTDPVFVDPGRYRVIVSKDKAEASLDIEITADTLAQPEFILNAGFLTVRPLTTQGGAPIDRAPVDLAGAGGVETGHYGVETRLLPAGDYAVAVRDGNASAKASAQVTAGEATVLDVIVASGLAVVDVYYTAGMIMEDIGQAVDIYEAKSAIDGSRKQVTGGYGAAQEFTLPPGDYVAVAGKDSAQAEIPFTVTANERANVTVVLNAGVLAATATGARGMEVFSAKKDIQGNRKSIRYDYGETLQSTLTAGDYVVEAEIDDVKTEKAVSVIAGERAEITFP